MLDGSRENIRGVLADWDHARVEDSESGSTQEKFRSVSHSHWSQLRFAYLSIGDMAVDVYCHAARPKEAT
jgi:hypothetical protein